MKHHEEIRPKKAQPIRWTEVARIDPHILRALRIGAWHPMIPIKKEQK